MNAAEKRHLDRVSAMGCVICGGPAEIHHLRTVCGMSQRASNYLVIGLCPEHHRQGSFGQAVHNGYQEFSKNHGSEADLLAKTIERLMK